MPDARPILVTGGTGQLASALSAAPGILRVGRPVFDFDHPDSIQATFRAIAPRIVVNAAAYTAVDAAESNADAAYRANAEGPGILARLCAAADIPLIHVSTDYVFDGTKPTPYQETDPVAPQGVYGASKLAGEVAVREAGGKAIILRTAWVYAPAGKNFVRTMLTAGKTRDRLTVVGDQHGSPTTASDLADAILAIIARIDRTGWQPAYGGIFHAAGAGDTTWHGLAVATFEEAARHGAKMPEVVPIATSDWPTPAKRPANSRLDCTRLNVVFGVNMPHWRDSLTRTVDTIFATAPP
jgi:dTDP-4-dehydrorhamnose reductase